MDTTAAYHGTGGQIVTFYSNRGGLGRSMAVANVATLMARSQKRVLVIDMDMNSPNQHSLLKPRENEDDISRFHAGPGMVELLEQTVPAQWTERDSFTLRDADERIRGTGFSHFITKTRCPGLDLMKAGRLDSTFSARSMSIPWTDLRSTGRFSALLWSLGNILKERYDYVIVDAPHGVGACAEISRTQLADVLVTMFSTWQSLSELGQAACQTVFQRQRCFRPVTLLPVPTRVELAIPYNATKARLSYQAFFEGVLAEAYQPQVIPLADHFRNIFLPEILQTSFPDELVAHIGDSGPARELFAAYRRLTRLILGGVPWAPVFEPQRA